MKVFSIAVILATIAISSAKANCGFKGPWPELDAWARALPEGDRDKIDFDQGCNSIKTKFHPRIWPRIWPK